MMAKRAIAHFEHAISPADSHIETAQSCGTQSICSILLEQVLCKDLPTELTHLWWLSSDTRELLILRGVHCELKLADLASLLKTLTEHDAAHSRELHKHRFFQMKGDGTNTAPGCYQPSLKKVATECEFPHDNESLLSVQKLSAALCDRARHAALRSDKKQRKSRKAAEASINDGQSTNIARHWPEENKENHLPAMRNQQLPSPASLMWSCQCRPFLNKVKEATSICLQPAH